MKYFKNKVGAILGVENKSVIAQFEKRPEDYEPCDKNGNSLIRVKKASRAKEAAEAQEAPKAKGTK